MALSRSTALLLLLPCPAVVFLSASLEDVSATSQCLSSPEAVRQEYPGAWASWTMQEPGHKGVKCWFPAMRENHARRLEIRAHKNEKNEAKSEAKSEAVARKSTAERPRDEPVADSKAPDEAPLASASEMNVLGWSFRSRTARIGVTAFDWDAMAESSFDDRFAAAFEVSSVSQPSIIQRMMDPIGAIP